MSSRPPIDVDALLGGWPEPSRPTARGAQAWDELADSTLARARAAPTPAQEAQIDSLLAAPTLESEPGEPTTAGVSKMSESDDDKPRPSLRRPSLKELAERVSKTPPPPSSLPPSSLGAPAPPSSLSAVASTPPSSPPASMAGPASATPASLSALARASQPIITTRDSAPPASAGPSSAAIGVSPAAESHPPPSRSSVSESPPSAAPASNVVQLSEAKPAAKSGGSSYRAIGVAIFGLGAAAAAAMFFMGKTTESPVEPSKPAVVAVAPKSDEPKPAEPEAVAKKDDAADDGTLDIANLDDAVAKVEPTADEPLAPPASAPPGWTPPPKPTGTARVEPEGDLASAMKDAVGAETAKPVEATPATEPTPAGALPDRPPVGSVTSAINGAMGAAKACVAGADDVSRATVTFGSSGAVQSVSVGGWAASKGGAASCIKAAFQSARVSPFSKPTFTTGATIRP